MFDDDIHINKDSESAKKLNRKIIELCNERKYWYFAPNLEIELAIKDKSTKNKPYVAYKFFKDYTQFENLLVGSKRKLAHIVDWINDV